MRRGFVYGPFLPRDKLWPWPHTPALWECETIVKENRESLHKCRTLARIVSTRRGFCLRSWISFDQMRSGFRVSRNKQNAKRGEKTCTKGWVEIWWGDGVCRMEWAETKVMWRVTVVNGDLFKMIVELNSEIITGNEQDWRWIYGVTVNTSKKIILN